MKSIKFILRNYTTKDGIPFSVASCKGQYLPLALASVEETYKIKFTAKSLCPMPTKEGIYEVAFEDNGIWIDSRPEFEDKHIVHINAVKVVFSKKLEKKQVEETQE